MFYQWDTRLPGRTTSVKIFLKDFYLSIKHHAQNGESHSTLSVVLNFFNYFFGGLKRLIKMATFEWYPGGQANCDSC
jgi:hypothetical protein